MPPIRTGEDVDPRPVLKTTRQSDVSLPGLTKGRVSMTPSCTVSDIGTLSATLARTHLAHDPLRWVVSAFNASALGCVDDTCTRDMAYILALYTLWRDVVRAPPTNRTWETLPLPPGFEPLVRLIPALEVRLDPQAELAVEGEQCGNCAALDRDGGHARLEHGWMRCWRAQGGACARCAANQLRCSFLEDSGRRARHPLVDDRVFSATARRREADSEGIAHERFARIADDVRTRFTDEVWAPELVGRIEIEAERAKARAETVRLPLKTTASARSQPRFWTSRPSEDKTSRRAPSPAGVGRRDDSHAVKLDAEVGQPRRNTVPPRVSEGGLSRYPSTLPAQFPHPVSPGPGQEDRPARRERAGSDGEAIAAQLHVSVGLLFDELHELHALPDGPETTRRLRRLVVAADDLLRRAVEGGVVPADLGRQWSVVVQSFDCWMHAAPGGERAAAAKALLRDVGPLSRMFGRALDSLRVAEQPRMCKG